MGRQKELGFGLGFLVLVSFFSFGVESSCSRGCDLAYASYDVWTGSTLTIIAQIFQTSIDDILKRNPQVANQDSVQAGARIEVPFSCDCINGSFLGHVSSYKVNNNDTYNSVATKYYSNLTTVEWLQRFNPYPPTQIPDTANLTVVVNCSCGDSAVSNGYGLFLTYPLRPGESLRSVARNYSLSDDLLQRYNRNSKSLLYVPVKDGTGSYVPLRTSSAGGISGGAIAGVCIGVVAAILLAAAIYIGIHRKKREKEAILLLVSTEALGGTLDKSTESTRLVTDGPPGLSGITVNKSVEFSYEELAKATSEFSLANKIGQGGFGAVYYAELRGEKAAIKKMDMLASKEFLAELKVLTHVHHLNLVRLIGYCVEDALFLVYEYIENGNLSQHLRGSARPPLSWASRVQIALDSARGLEYIHEHTVPVYIHRDIKSANILIDKDFHGKVADFGLTKLTEVGNNSVPTRLVGTFGYMPPEYAQYGDVSPKVDVFAFGVVLFELISAKEAIVKAPNSEADSRGLVALFDSVLSEPDSRDELRKVVDPRLGDNYSLDAVCKMAQLAKACTHENPQVRPSMRSVVVALMTLSSTTEDWDVGAFYENQALVNLMSGR